MKKIIGRISVIAILTLAIVAVCPFIATDNTKAASVSFAEGEAVASIGETMYATLAEANNALQDDDTLKLLADVSTDSIEISKAITFDLNGKTLSATSDTSTLTLAKDVEFTGNGTVAIKVINNGALSGNATFTKAGTNNVGGTISGGTFALARILSNYGTVSGGSFARSSEASLLYTVAVYNYGTISGGSFVVGVTNSVNDTATGLISGGTFDYRVNNNATIDPGTGTDSSIVFNKEVICSSTGTILGGTFRDTVSNSGTISGGLFEKTSTTTTPQSVIANLAGGHINKGTFNSSVANYGVIESNGSDKPVFSKEVRNDSGEIKDGTFNAIVYNYSNNEAKISGGTFNGTVSNSNNITGGVFNGAVTNNTGGVIYGGTFEASVNNHGRIEETAEITAPVFKTELSTNGTLKNIVTSTVFTEAFDNRGFIEGCTLYVNVTIMERGNNCGVSNSTFKAPAIIASAGLLGEGCKFESTLTVNTNTTLSADHPITNLVSALQPDLAFFKAEGSGYTLQNGNVATLSGVEVRSHTPHTFSSETGFCACGYECPHTSVDESNECLACGGQMVVSIVSTGSETVGYYIGFGNAMSALVQGDEVKLLGNIVLDKDYTVEKSMTLDLNGKTVSGSHKVTFDSAVTVKGNGTFATGATLEFGSTARVQDTISADISVKSGATLSGTANITGSFTNNGTISAGTFTLTTTTINYGTISGGTFTLDDDFFNSTDGIISGGTFQRATDATTVHVVNNNSVISGGTFATHGAFPENIFVFNGTGGCIRQGTFNGQVENSGSIEDNGSNSPIFNQYVGNASGGEIKGGIFNAIVSNIDSTASIISGGTFNGDVTNYGIIKNGTFTGVVNNHEVINGGTFEGAVNSFDIIEETSATTVLKFKGDVSNVGELKNITTITVFEPEKSINSINGKITGCVLNVSVIIGESGGNAETTNTTFKAPVTVTSTGVIGAGCKFESSVTVAEVAWTNQVVTKLFSVLRPDLAFFKAEGSGYTIQNGNVRTLTGVETRSHTPHTVLAETGFCACGYECPHTSLSSNGVCETCSYQFGLKIEAAATIYVKNLEEYAAIFENYLGNQVTLCRDITLNTTVSFGAYLMLDLNGKTISGTGTIALPNEYFGMPTSGVTVIFSDSASGGKVDVNLNVMIDTVTGGGSYKHVTVNAGNLYVNDGTFDKITVNSGAGLSTRSSGDIEIELLDANVGEENDIMLMGGKFQSIVISGEASYKSLLGYSCAYVLISDTSLIAKYAKLSEMNSGKTVAVEYCSEHNWVNGTCEYHGEICNHTDWTNGACSNCGIACEHTNWTAGVCDNCNTVCTHTGGTSTCEILATCSVCGEEYGTYGDHNYGTWIPVQPATCTEAGTKGHFECELCHANFDEDRALIDNIELSPLDHDFATEWTIDTPADCVNVGSKSHHCSRCTAKSDVTPISALGHTGGTATCKDKATCSVCNVQYGEFGEHSYGTWIPVQPATCTEAGTKGHFECGLCHANFDENRAPLDNIELSPLNHDFATAWSIDAPADCVNAGSKSHHCSRCTAKSDVTPISALGHTGGTATCKDKATCSVCNVQYGELNTNHHTLGIIWVKTADTHTQKWSCCDAVVVTTEAHEWKNGVCTECGYVCAHTGGTATCVQTATCSTCGYHYGEVNAHNHTDLVAISAVAPTVGSDGNIVYYRCSACGRCYSDQSAQTEITIADTVIPKNEPIITEGVGAEWIKGETRGLVFISDVARSQILDVLVDGVKVDTDDYTIGDDGSVSLVSGYLNTIPSGTHALTLRTTNGDVTVSFTIADEPMSVGGWVGIAIAILVVICVIVFLCLAFTVSIKVTKRESFPWRH